MLIPVYATALFLSAFLLFWIQPLFTKMVLPLLGGTPAVWNTAMMFFQLMLLAGYAYAHLLTRSVRPGRQVWVHGAVAALALGFLPIGVAAGWTPPRDHSPVFWLVGLLAASLGLPFFVLAASAPLLQTWFARTGHRLGADPYFLYAASNLGSLLALAAFPALLEPSLTLGQQSLAWALLYGLLLLLLGACALPARQIAAQTAGPTAPARPPVASAGTRQILIWIALAAVPSSLLLGVTNYIATDLASVPLLWVVPLGLYLLSFILAFSPRLRGDLRWALKGQAAGLLLVTTLILLALVFSHGAPIELQVLAHLLTFFLTAVICHTELANRRPGVELLTPFYLCMSAGGAIGGMFNALLAPALFSSTYEYYLGLVAACALRAVIGRRAERLVIGDILYPAALAALLIAAVTFLGEPEQITLALRGALLMGCALPLYGFSDRPWRFTLGVAAMLGSALVLDGSADILHQDRSFFGVNRVKRIEGGSRLAFIHGTTMHGSEFTDPSLWREPLAYYSRTGPAGQLLATRPGTHSVAAIGLGTGALACYRQPGQDWQFFEIDPAVARIARDTRYFHYLSECAGDTPIILGDGRLSLQAVPDGSEDVIVVDAFSSDAIPLHLLTREALQLYLQKLSPHGTVLLHISNLYLDLAPVVATLAASVGATAEHQLYQPSAAERASGAGPAEWVAIARDPADLDFLDARWQRLTPVPGARVWTDDFSNIVSAIRW
jgi:spermidine synthase